MGHKFLDDIGFDLDWGTDGDKRNSIWAEQREKYGVDERDTWNLDITMMALLYERLMLYKKVANEIIDLEFHEIEVEYNGESNTLTLLDWIDRLLEMLEHYLTSNTVLEEEEYSSHKIWTYWSQLSAYMWW